MLRMIFLRMIFLSTALYLQPVLAETLPWVEYTHNVGVDDHRTDELMLQFIGAGGVYLAYGQQAVLADPFYSNPPLSKLALFRALQPDKPLIDAHLPPLNWVRAILLGHAHYDHALDVPYILQQLPGSVGVYGSNTMKNVLAPIAQSERLTALNPVMATATSPGGWVYINPFLRVLAIESQHSRHLGPWTFFDDQVIVPRAHLPQRATQWPSGIILNYVIDWLDAQDKPVFRVLYQSSAASAPHGFPPESVLHDGKGFDVAILSVASADKAKDYPAALLDLINPRHVVAIHWERFWQPYSPGNAQPLNKKSLHAFFAGLDQLAGTFTPYLPQRGAWLSLPAAPM
jgi:L-ascorbate metabolism protein UlaG (beta-lactamase superfamily)